MVGTMSGQSLGKASAKRLITALPGPTNWLWKKLYPRLYKSSTEHVEHHSAAGASNTDPRATVFSEIFRNNKWENGESVSGYGSTMFNTTVIRRKLPELVEKLGVTSVLDAPCGDFHWMRHVTFPEGVMYVGCDIVPDLVAELNEKYADATHRFDTLDIVEGPIPDADFWLCRDTLFHLNLEDGLRVLENAARSNARYFATTTYDVTTYNSDIATGEFRFINMRLAPFDMPKPVAQFDDFLAPNAPRQLAIWSTEQLRQRFGI